MDTRQSRNFVPLAFSLMLLGSLVLGAALPAQVAHAGGGGGVLYVKPGGVLTGSCASWAAACRLTYALHLVAGPGDQLWVAKGTYKPTTGTDRSMVFSLKNGVAVYGGFAGTETALSQRNWKTNVTILSGDIGTVGVASDNSYTVVLSSANDTTAVLDGFTITGGNANVASYEKGGGMYINVGSPTLKNLVITKNSATWGGGMYNASSNPIITNVTFSANSVSKYGGGMYNSYSSPKLTNLVFSNNTAAYGGGGTYNSSSNPVLTNVIFAGNRATYTTGSGAGMYNYYSNPTLTKVTFSGNTVPYAGSGMYNDSSSNGRITNVTFSGNSAAWGGGGMYNYSSAPILTNVTFSGNTAVHGSGGMENHESSTPNISNSIFWGDGSQEIFNSTSAPTIANSIVQGGCPAGSTCTSVISSNPILGPLQNNGGFAKTMALGAGSPAIDKGKDVTCAIQDERGVARPQGLACDLGAYEVKVAKFVSQAAYDGWVFESAPGSNKGGTYMDSVSSSVLVGDLASNARFRGFLSFNTASLADTTTVVAAKLRVMLTNSLGSPFANEGSLVADLAKPYFGSGLALVSSDWEASATVSPAGSFPSVQLPNSSWYTAGLNASARTNINKTGTTQFRLRFTAENNNGLVDYLSFYSGEYAMPERRPVLLVYYNP